MLLYQVCDQYSFSADPSPIPEKSNKVTVSCLIGVGGVIQLSRLLGQDSEYSPWRDQGCRSPLEQQHLTAHAIHAISELSYVFYILQLSPKRVVNSVAHPPMFAPVRSNAPGSAVSLPSFESLPPSRMSFGVTVFPAPLSRDNLPAGAAAGTDIGPRLLPGVRRGCQSPFSHSCGVAMAVVVASGCCGVRAWRAVDGVGLEGGV